MSEKIELQTPCFDKIPFIGSGKKLKKKRLSVGSTAIIKDILDNEYKVTVTEEISGKYKGITDIGVNIEFIKNNVFLIL